jgi:hypothetical protein
MVYCGRRTAFFIPHFILFPLSFSGTLVTLPPSMKEFNISYTSVKIDVAAIEWPANATALVYDASRWGKCAMVCRTTDLGESKEGAETSEIRIKCEPDQVIGTSSAWRVINTYRREDE